MAEARSTLSALLSAEEPMPGFVVRDDEEEDALVQKTLANMCIECGDQPAVLSCNECEDRFCEVCFMAQHKRGKRAQHTTKPIALPTELLVLTGSGAAGAVASASGASAELKAESPAAVSMDTAGDEKKAEGSGSGAGAPPGSAAEAFDGHSAQERAERAALYDARALSTNEQELSGKWFTERAKYIPLRLTLRERKYLRLLEAALNVSEYTDKIDIISARDKAKRIFQQLKDMCAILSGLVVACDYKEGQRMIADKDFKTNAAFFQYIFELGRRHKIRNPEKMRDAYGKLLYLLMDSQIPEIVELLDFRLVSPLKTVYSMLADRECLDLLSDPLLPVATGEIFAQGKSRPEIDRMIKRKENAIENIARKYSATGRIEYEEARTCILSICDNHSYLRGYRDPCDKMIAYLKQYFKEDAYETGFSLAIVGGRGGSRLTHSHKAQYHYVLQSLTLWREIQHEMFKLWYLSEEDMLDETNGYRLRNTGQGLNRIQACPRVGRCMYSILSHCQRKVDNWVGSSVIHLGDHNVPNALMFIDKYNQVPRILGPIVRCLDQLDEVDRKPDTHAYIKSAFGDVHRLRMTILTDFFRHGFDGSGADNFFDAGSCIDGRLTSAWNFCSTIEKKPYFPAFLLTGFTGFDGQF